ncbi:MAG: SRPBCC family protein [Paracoccaceae bacterium]|uniref:SRPBCC family protein n=1 Tax=Shimia thalassica TaxID=1715693 RepID=UPI0032993821
MKITMSVCIRAPKSQVWKVLADVENIPLWSSAVVSAKADDKKPGIGTKRTCRLSNQSAIFEEWTDWNENESYTYRGFNLTLIESAQNTWSVKKRC